MEYAEAIQKDVKWLGFDWEERLFHASDYFDQLYQWAIQLIHEGKAFVCDLAFEDMRKYRGTLTEPGQNSPFRDRSAEENLDLFERMKEGEFEEGTKTLGKNRHELTQSESERSGHLSYSPSESSETGDKWKIYPSYDYAHGQSDSLEGLPIPFVLWNSNITAPLRLVL